MSGKVVAIDHFAGLGWGVACHRLGILEYGVEIAKSAIRMRAANGMRTIYRDVWSGLLYPWMVPFHRLYIASPPCQTFSIAGKGEGREALEQVLAAIDARLFERPADLIALGERLDPRTALVLAPLAHIWAHRPELVALEQVPEVLPVWHAYATVMRGMGYSVHVEIMRSEQYGVPQTRRRAILMARLDGKVQPPAPTHSQYYPTSPGRLDPGVQKWVSMAEALGFGLFDRPSPTITGGGTETGGAEPIAKLARYTESESWVLKGNQKPAGSTTLSGYQERSVNAPAQSITSQAGLYRFEERPALLRSQYGVGGNTDERGERLVDEPASTITSKSGSMKWVHESAHSQANGVKYRPMTVPAKTVTSDFGGLKLVDESEVPERALELYSEVTGQPRDELAQWPWIDAPATTVAGDPRITAREHHEHGEQSGTSLRLTYLEAAALQSFPASMRWPGNQGERFLAIGNAVPPLMAEAVLGALLEPAGVRDEWDLAFAEITG